MTDAQITFLLTSTASGPLWRDYLASFDTGVSATNPKVRFLRSFILQAGPIEDGETRFENIKDNPKAQAAITTKFHKTLREMASSGDPKYKDVYTRVYGRLIYNVIF